MIHEGAAPKPRPSRNPYGHHATDLAFYATPRGMRHQPVCSCGWRGRAYIEGTDANRAAEDHQYSAHHRATGRWEA